MSDLESFLDDQHPFRPSTKDWERLMEVVRQMEALKALGVSAEQAYADIVDVPTVAYLGVNRAGMNLRPGWDSPSLRKAVMDLMANSWVEGFAYGVTFEREGGHRSEDDRDG